MITNLYTLNNFQSVRELLKVIDAFCPKGKCLEHFYQ
jgi:hypothetical protein